MECSHSFYLVFARRSWAFLGACGRKWAGRLGTPGPQPRAQSVPSCSRSRELPSLQQMAQALKRLPGIEIQHLGSSNPFKVLLHCCRCSLGCLCAGTLYCLCDNDLRCLTSSFLWGQQEPRLPPSSGVGESSWLDGSSGRKAQRGASSCV